MPRRDPRRIGKFLERNRYRNPCRRVWRKEEAVRTALERRPDVVLLRATDDEDGLRALQRLGEKLPGVPVVMLAASGSLTYVAGDGAGPPARFPRVAAASSCLRRLGTAAAGGNAWTEEQVRRFRGAPTVPADVASPLTPRELQVLRQLALGLPNREIALMLSISNETVKEHVGRVLRKLEVSDRTKAAVWAIRHALD